MTIAAQKNADLRNVWIKPLSAYAAFIGVLIISFNPTFQAMVQTWAQSSSYTHGFLVIPAALWMISETRKPVVPQTSAIPLIGVGAGALIWVLGRAAGILIVEEIALVALAISGVGVFLGSGALRAWGYPLAFLFFMVPFGESLLPILQTLTAHAAVALLKTGGEVAAIDGYMIETRAGFFEVAEACAGLRFLLAAMMIAAIFAHLSLPTMRQRITFLGIAVVVAITANVLRAYLLILIATLSDMRFAVGADHAALGLVFYALVFLVLFRIGERMKTKARQSEFGWTDISPAPWRPFIAATAFAIVTAAAAYAGIIISAAPATPSARPPALISASGWRVLPPPQNWRAQFPNADTTAGATYKNGDDMVFLALGGITYDRIGHEIVNYENRSFDGETWRKLGEIREVVYLFGTSQERTIEILAGPERRRLAVIKAWWWNGKIYHNPIALKRAQMFAKLKGENPPGGVMFIAASFTHQTSEALDAIRRFTVAAETAQQWTSRMKAQD